ncbi:MAG: hypothetical protein GTO02_03115, partial [Candidatus Dadabacteria bacterium]|nr:hypothetical protein [Candidatus Dadabacteria bacterium]
MKKSLKYRGHHIRKTPQYGNCEVLGPDGNLMFRCCQKKALWYLERNLGNQISKEPFTIQLTFTPKGKGHVDDPYFLQIMKNLCVVCGSDENLTRHHVVPYCYRKFFPTNLKDHRSYDVMALCIPCHELYEEKATEFKEELAVKHSAPVSGTGARFDKALSAARGAARAILEHGNKIPPARKDILIER